MHSGVAPALNGVAHDDLRPIKRLGGSWKTEVWLLSDAQGRKLVLKRYIAAFEQFEKERDFLLRGGHSSLRALYLPEVIESGEDFLLLEFVPREHLTRETVSTREWTDDDIDLWVKGLLEFQQLQPNRRVFSIRHQLAGLAYPVVRMVKQLGLRGPTLSLRQKLMIARLLFSYLAMRPFFRNLCTHYDLQTYNYTFMIERRRVSMLDYEFKYYLGDPYFDILYYVTIPPVRWSEWTFQRRLLIAFFSSMKGRRKVNVGRETRIRLILLGCNIGRHLYFDKDPEKQRVYADNIRDLLDNGSFAALCSDLLGE